MCSAALYGGVVAIYGLINILIGWPWWIALTGGASFVVGWAGLVWLRHRRAELGIQPGEQE